MWWTLSHIQETSRRNILANIWKSRKMKVYFLNWVENILWHEKKLLFLSTFSYHNVFKSCLLQRHQKVSVCWEGLTKFPACSVYGAFKTLLSCDLTKCLTCSVEKRGQNKKGHITLKQTSGLAHSLIRQLTVCHLL